MQIIQSSLLALAAGSLIATSSHAAINYGNGMVAEPYIGIKVGQYDLEDVDDQATSYGLYGGAKFTPNWGFEAEYLTTSETEAFDDLDEKGVYEADILGLYATYNYNFPNASGIYAKGRLGISKNDKDIEITDKLAEGNDESGSFSGTGIAGGLGLGYNIAPNAAVELAYDWYPTLDVDDTDMDASGITLGANFKF